MAVATWVVLGAIALMLLAFFAIRKPPPLATGRVEAGAGKVLASVDGVLDRGTAVPMALCYAAKIRWLTLSEGEQTQDVLKNLFGLTVRNWPEIPYVEMLASLSQTPSVYSVQVRYDPRGSGWFVTNNLPRLGNKGDLVTHYFFLLREIARALSAPDRDRLGQALRSFTDVLFVPESEADGLAGLRFLNREANRLVALHSQGVPLR